MRKGVLDPQPISGVPAVFTQQSGNAFFDATGVRLREYPLTPRRVLAALKSR